MTPAMELAPHKPSFLDLPYSHLSDRSLQFPDGQTCRPDELSHASSCHNEHIVNDLLGRGHLAVESCHANLVSSSTSRTASAVAPNSSRALGPRSLRLSALLIAMGQPWHQEVENNRTSATCFIDLRTGAWRGSVRVPGSSLSHRLPSLRRVALIWSA
jgi:hypothetical protein